jgi:hypothetical protein
MMFRWVFFAILAVLLASWLFSKRLPWLEKLGLTTLKRQTASSPSYLHGSFGDGGVFNRRFAV